MKAAYRRLLIKLSGGQLAGEKGFGINPAVIGRTATQIREVHELGIQICVVVGGGNIIRGIAAADEGMDRAIADYMGMMASVINALALQDALENEGLDTRVQSAIEIKTVAEAYIRRRAIRHLEKGRVVVFAGGTGNPYFTTDTAAVLRAAEVQAEIVLMAKQGIDGVQVDYYGTPTPLNQLANLTTPDPRLIVVSPYDKGAMSDIEKAILKADLGLSPSNDGKVVRVPVPPLTEERRKELVKQVHRAAEDHKVGIRDSRRESLSMLKDLESEGALPKDDKHRQEKKIQALTDAMVKNVDAIAAQKEEDILQV